MALRPGHVAPELLNKVTKALGITALDQWYYVSHTAVAQAIGARALNKFGGTSGFLKLAYPNHHFDEEKLSSKTNLEKDQKFMEVVIRKLFPNTEIQTKARRAVGIINPETDAYLEIDFWMPELKLGIEYQDKHHFEYQWYANKSLQEYQKNDNIKKATMLTLGYTLITIGCWWDKTLESVASTIRKFRPDLLLEYEGNTAEPIPSDPPPGFITASPVIPGVAGVMNPFIPTVAFDPTNWYAGEKHDGIRGVFNPTLNKIFSRSGNELSILPALLNDIPNMLIEGEIMAGRGNYNKTAAVSYYVHHDRVNWPIFRYLTYDIPDAEMGNYTQRYSAILRESLARPYVFAQPAFRVLVANKAHLKMVMDTILSDAGEGVIVQKDALYEYGRATTLAKIKVRRDADAQVLRVHENSCTCKLINGGTVEIVFSENFDPSSLKVGDIVSYYYKRFSVTDQPKQAEIYKVRYDLTWDQLTSEKKAEVKRRSVKDAAGGRALIASNARNKLGHWNKAANVRAFLDEFARTSGFDALVPENWYSVKIISLRKAGSGGLLSAYNYNKTKIIADAYPELKFEAAKFSTRKPLARKHMGYWNKLSNQRAFLDEFARNSGFDPHVPENWYSITISSVEDSGGSGMLKVHGYSLLKALNKAYPDMKLDAERFKSRKERRAKVRAYFNEFARVSGFDPLVPDNWYSIELSTLRQVSTAPLAAYSYDLRQALKFAYPELTLELHKLKNRDKVRANVRGYFDKFARTSGFDPLVVDNWYSIKPTTLRKAGMRLAAYSHDLRKALVYAYHELKFEQSKFSRRSKPRANQVDST